MILWDKKNKKHQFRINGNYVLEFDPKTQIQRSLLPIPTLEANLRIWMDSLVGVEAFHADIHIFDKSTEWYVMWLGPSSVPIEKNWWKTANVGIGVKP